MKETAQEAQVYRGGLVGLDWASSYVRSHRTTQRLPGKALNARVWALTAALCSGSLNFKLPAV